LSQALNVFLFNSNINLGATIQALQARNVLQILAEPNVLAMNGRPASFLAGGEFPFPNLQGGGAGLGAVTIQFREFGVRINFVPTLTPRGTIHMQVTPEVSSLDFANGLVFQGFTIPALSTRRVSTEVELSDGQSFAIGGLLDNRTTEALTKIPGLGDIPFFGKLFRSRNLSKNNTELLVLVTPEIVRPIPAGQPLPDLKRPTPLMEPNTSSAAPRTPAEPAVAATTESIPMEELLQSLRGAQAGVAGQTPQMQFVPMLVSPTPGAPVTPPPPNSTVPAAAPAKPSAGAPQ
jgi:pilus assembly protein CpaC